ncbi:hypothetical protein BKA57DRAFT_321559 [Linnemannia elongata]|nr:hypothetical protein BKA57DRAFT_321559 [Linnemannia elongata]
MPFTTYTHTPPPHLHSPSYLTHPRTSLTHSLTLPHSHLILHSTAYSKPHTTTCIIHQYTKSTHSTPPLTTLQNEKLQLTHPHLLRPPYPVCLMSSIANSQRSSTCRSSTPGQDLNNILHLYAHPPLSPPPPSVRPISLTTSPSSTATTLPPLSSAPLPVDPAPEWATTTTTTTIPTTRIISPKARPREVLEAEEVGTAAVDTTKPKNAPATLRATLPTV